MTVKIRLLPSLAEASLILILVFTLPISLGAIVPIAVLLVKVALVRDKSLSITEKVSLFSLKISSTIGIEIVVLLPLAAIIPLPLVPEFKSAALAEF